VTYVGEASQFLSRGLHILGLDSRTALHYNAFGIKNSARCAGRGSRNTKEVKTAGSRHSPAVEVRAGVLLFWTYLLGVE
jgi:hypothetical protein